MKPVSVVIIGLNVENWIADTIRSVQNQEYPVRLDDVIYVDSGSTDATLSIVSQFPDVKVLSLSGGKPSAAKARNLGLRNAKYPLVQLVDADSWLHPRWLQMAVPCIETEVVAVTGLLHERFPGKNWMHLVTDVDWQIVKAVNENTVRKNQTRSFGGNVLVSRRALLAAGGYDESLQAGEDPDLSYRIRQVGWKICQLQVPMASHDINIRSFRSYWRRAVRTGEVFGTLSQRYKTGAEQLYRREKHRVLIQGLLVPVALIADLVSGVFPVLSLTGTALFFRNMIRPTKPVESLNLPVVIRLWYGFHLSLIVIPQMIGVLKQEVKGRS